jgi:succinoglycan biosynthesis transport protein ExoP
MNPQESRGETGERYLSALRRGLPIVLVTTIVVAAAAVLVSLQQGPEYEASANVFVSTNNVNSTIANLPILSTDPQRVLDTQALVARVDAVARIAVKKADVPGITPDELLAQSSVTSDPNADILIFTVTNPDSDTARKLADAYAQAYLSYRTHQDLGSIKHARQGLEQQIKELQSTSHPDPQVLSDLEGRDEQLRTAELVQKGNVSLGAPASASQTQPKPVRNGFLGGILGIVLGIALVFVRDALNTRVRSTAEIEERLGMPLLGRIPPPPKRLAEANKLSTIHEPHTSSSEAYRMLATNLELLNLDRGASSIMISSPMHAEGKSTTAANLAVSFARRGLNIALLEADLRRPSLRGFFELDEGPGLADVALGTVELDDAVVHPALGEEEDSGANGASATPGRLELLAGGVRPPSPAEFLKAHAVSDVIVRLTERNDLLLIDTPPLLQVSDAMTLILASQVDCLILAARLGVIRRQALSEAKRILDSAPVVKLGFFATGAAAATERYGGYGYYSYYQHAGGAAEPKVRGRAKA